jgi:glycosyltransferase involved in cell wall biosynthesis
MNYEYTDMFDEIEWLNARKAQHNYLLGPSVSIVLATFNGEQFLGDLLDSLKKQKYSPIEIIIGDDGSSDQTLKLVEEFAENCDIHVGLKRGANQGSSENFLSTAKFSSGDWIIFCDQDDIWSENRIASAIEEISIHPDLCAIFQSCEICDEDLTPRSKTLFPGTHMPGVYHANSIDLPHIWPGFLQVLRRDVVELAFLCPRPLQNHYFQTKNFIAHDRWTFILANMTGKVLVQDISVAKFRRHSRAQTGFYDGKKNRLDKIRTISQIRYKRNTSNYAHFLALQAFMKRDASINSKLPKQLIEETSERYLKWAIEAKILSMILGGAHTRRLWYWIFIGLVYSQNNNNYNFINKVIVNVLLRIFRK